jgi:hypothetical protein
MEAVELKTTNQLAVERNGHGNRQDTHGGRSHLDGLDSHSLSMLSFGFTIYKFLLYVRESLSNNILKAHGPRRFGLVLIALGTVFMVFGLIDYYKTYRQFSKASSRCPWSFSFLR